ncbi:hypothetical protein DC498_17900 [Terrimonas sp.]|uniref:hypothetical protein n=1 Tax=Terrimonas sp. TaxID=1914338 RepID=UPI000D522B30|nr:hypothetical protein [Terrimonas sp.]PVD50842.1 hypothetical protein DC498_17900 [Terrimonas sp.]
MTTIIARRHFYKFYLSIIFGTLFFVTLATFLLFIYIKSVGKEQLMPSRILMPVFSIVCYFFAAYTLYRYIKNVPKIELNKNFIAFNKEVFALCDIKSVVFTGKRPFKYLVDFPMEAATLTFNSGKTKYIFDEMYANSAEIKSFLKHQVIDKAAFFPTIVPLPDSNIVEGDSYVIFRGEQLTSIRGLMLWGFIVFIVYLLISVKSPNPSASFFIVSGFAVFWFILFSYQMHYFKVSDNYFIVRNHNFFWKKKVYKISDIKEVTFETQSKMPYCLRIITKDFRNELYPASTLSDAMWLTLKEKLEGYNINVRNECV